MWTEILKRVLLLFSLICVMPSKGSDSIPSWNVTDGNGTICIMLQMVANLTISYNNTDNKIVNGTFGIPENAVSNGSCPSGTIMLFWEDISTHKTNFLILGFEKNSTHKNFALSSIEIIIHLNNTDFPNSTGLVCDMDIPSNIPPVAIGVSLAVLVLLVIGAYIFGKHRPKAKGYQSV